MTNTSQRDTIASMDKSTLARFKAEHFAKLQPLLRDDGLHLPVGVIYAVARIDENAAEVGEGV